MAQIIEGKLTDLDGLSVSRILPNRQKRMVGPFIFLDHMGPASFAAGEGIDVRPHPHIGLATLTYLFEGSLLHRDSLGNNLEITPGDVNWMTAGRGIVHSERETLEVKAGPHTLNGLQAWVALPEQEAEIEPSFTHISRCQLPHILYAGVQMRLIAGEAFGQTSPIKTWSPMFYLDVLAKAGSQFQRPSSGQECLLYVISGSVRLENEIHPAGSLVLLDDELDFQAVTHCRCILLGGDAWPRVPLIEWNFVSFKRERIEQAKQQWIDQSFPCIPGDNAEFTPLPVRNRSLCSRCYLTLLFTWLPPLSRCRWLNGSGSVRCWAISLQVF